MQYSKFQFTNFKGINNLEISVANPVTTLIGLNESGKTTILEAIFCFSYGAESLDMINPGLAFLRDPELWIPIKSRSNFSDSIKISATVQLDSVDKAKFRSYMQQSYGLTLSSIQDSFTINEEYFFSDSRLTAVSPNPRRSWYLTVAGTKGRQRNPRKFGAGQVEWMGALDFMKSHLPRIWYFPNFLFELPDRFALEPGPPGAPQEEQDRNSFYVSTFEMVVEALKKGANIKSHVIDRLRSGDVKDIASMNQLLLEMSREVSKTVFDNWNRMFVKLPAKQVVKIDANMVDGIPVLDLKIEGPDGYYDLSERSLGFRWFFMFLLMSNYRQGKEDNDDYMILLDEPASNLHSTAQAELLKSFGQLSEKCKIVYTTHSHHMINVKWLDSAYVVRNEAMDDMEMQTYLTSNTGAHTSIQATSYRTFVNEFPSKTSYFQPVLDLLEYRPSDLEPIPNVVIVEGKSDFYLLRYATDVLELSPRLKLVPGLGAGAVETLISLHIGWGKSFVVLLDGDTQGLKERDRYRRNFGGIVDQHIYCLPDCYKSAGPIEIEDLLDKTDKDMLISSIYPTQVGRPSEKQAILNAIMEILASGKKLTFSSNFVTKTEQLLSKLEEVMAAQGL